jgi:hypothetical protein
VNWSRGLLRLWSAFTVIFAGSAQAQTSSKEVWACVTEHMVGIQELSDKTVVTGNFKVDPEKFLLTIETSFGLRSASLSPEFTGPYQETESGPKLSTFKQGVGLGWLVFRNSEGQSPKMGGESERQFRLSYVWGGGEFLMRGRCVPF